MPYSLRRLVSQELVFGSAGLGWLYASGALPASRVPRIALSPTLGVYSDGPGTYFACSAYRFARGYGCRTSLCSTSSIHVAHRPHSWTKTGLRLRGRRTPAKSRRTPQRPVQPGRVGCPLASALCGPLGGEAVRSTCPAPRQVSIPAFRHSNAIMVVVHLVVGFPMAALHAGFRGQHQQTRTR